jgi:hypothetical protein
MGGGSIWGQLTTSHVNIDIVINNLKMWIGSVHRYRSHQISIHGCKCGYLLAV